MIREPSWVGSLSVRFTDRRKSGRRIWELTEPLQFSCVIDDRLQTVRVRRGFKTDFASVPLVVRKFIHPVGPYAPATVIHDYLYINQIGDRLTADRIFLEAMKASRVNPITRSLIYRAVRMFGAGGWGR